jgi:hypothetical protein
MSASQLIEASWLRRFVLPVIFLSASLPACLGAAASSDNKSEKFGPVTLRWDEATPGCTFSTTQDGKYQYGLRSGDVEVVLSVDSREVQIIRHRIEPIFGVFLTIHYRGQRGLDVNPNGITLQFLKHFRVVQSSLDTDDFTQKIQADADALDDETRRIIAKHPKEKDAREARLQDYQKSVSELIEFLGKNSLQSVHLDAGNREANGWVFFNTRNKWIGNWKAQEDFVLRVPMEGKVFEFPFKLPPKAGELLLRKRE